MKELLKLVIYLILAFALVILFISSGYWIYVLIKPYLMSTKGRLDVLKGYLILIALSAVGYILIHYLMQGPAYFEQGIEQLHKSKYIKDRVGDFNEYTYNPDKLLKEPISSATFQVQIPGDSLILVLTCTMVKDKDRWKLSKIHQDSITRKH